MTAERESKVAAMAAEGRAAAKEMLKTEDRKVILICDSARRAQPAKMSQGASVMLIVREA